MPAKIEIGGRIPRSVLPAFLELIKENGGISSFWEDPTKSPETEKELKEAMRETPFVSIYSYEQTGGQFPDLEKFSVKNQIPFDRHTPAYQEYDAELVRFRPGMSEPVVCISCEDEEPLVSQNEIRTLMKTFLGDIPDTTKGIDKIQVDSLVKNLGTFISRVLELCPEIEVLPPLEIVD
jgi:hypothetical protein